MSKHCYFHRVSSYWQPFSKKFSQVPQPYLRKCNGFSTIEVRQCLCSSTFLSVFTYLKMVPLRPGISQLQPYPKILSSVVTSTTGSISLGSGIQALPSSCNFMPTNFQPADENISSHKN